MWEVKSWSKVVTLVALCVMIVMTSSSGSMTLHHWQRLATPNLGGFLDDRHGVHIRGQRELPVQDDLYELSDYEEDGKKVAA